jgi:DNA replication protein DnaC
MEEKIIEKLETLRMKGMLKAFEEQGAIAASSKLSFEERLLFLLDREIIHKEERKLQSRLKRGKLRDMACIEELTFASARRIDKGQILTLSNCNWVRHHHNIIITGQTGVGKTFLACALADKACRDGHTILYTRTTRLLEKLFVARSDNSYQNELEKIAKIDILLLDDFGLEKLNETQRHDLLEVVEDRYNLKSTIVMTQFPIKNWHEIVGDKTIGDAILDRLVHNAHKIKLSGPSIREKNKPKI